MDIYDTIRINDPNAKYIRINESIETDSNGNITDTLHIEVLDSKDAIDEVVKRRNYNSFLQNLETKKYNELDEEDKRRCLRELGKI